MTSKKMQEIINEYKQLEGDISLILKNPSQKRNAQTLARYLKIKNIIEKNKQINQLNDNIQELKKILEDENEDKELKILAQEEITEINEQKEKIKTELENMLCKKKQREIPSKGILLEIRAGAGGKEASLFCQDLFTMYQKYSTHKNWKLKIMNVNFCPIGGIKEVIAEIEGTEVYKNLKFEAGVHRVQRVPQTEASGRIHTSTVSVVILPLVEDAINIKIENKDLKIDAFRASGAGGQSVNTTDSAIRITHLPTGIVVTQQDERSLHKNKSKAMKILYARLYKYHEEKKQKNISNKKKSQIGTGDRSERIRTYNFLQNRITDHRIKKSFHQIEKIMTGEKLEEIIKDLLDNLEDKNCEEKHV